MEKKCVECFERFEWSNICPRCSSRNTVVISQTPDDTDESEKPEIEVSDKTLEVIQESGIIKEVRGTITVGDVDPSPRSVDWDSLQSCCEPQTVACGGQTVEMVDGSMKWSDNADEPDKPQEFVGRVDTPDNRQALERSKEYWEDESE